MDELTCCQPMRDAQLDSGDMYESRVQWEDREADKLLSGETGWYAGFEWAIKFCPWCGRSVLADMLEKMAANLNATPKVMLARARTTEGGWIWHCGNCDQMVYGKTCGLCRDTIAVPGGWW